MESPIGLQFLVFWIPILGFRKNRKAGKTFKPSLDHILILLAKGQGGRSGSVSCTKSVCASIRHNIDLKPSLVSFQAPVSCFRALLALAEDCFNSFGFPFSLWKKEESLALPALLCPTPLIPCTYNITIPHLRLLSRKWKKHERQSCLQLVASSLLI